MSEATTVQVESLDEFARDPKGTQARWVAEVKLAQKEFERYHERCAKIERRYRAESEIEGQELGRGRLQLIWSTVQTQIPAVYQFPPEVEVSRRFKTKDRISRTAALMLERYLSVDADRDHIGDETLLVLLDRLLCDMGQMWVDYEPVIGKVMQPVAVMQGPRGEWVTAGGQPYSGRPPQAAPSADGQTPGPMMGEQAFDAVVDCRAPAVHINLEDFLHSPARKWREVRWVGRRRFYTRDECAEKFKDGMKSMGWKPADIPLTQKAKLSEDDEQKTGDLFKRAEVWELWDDENVYFVVVAMSVPLEIRKRPVRLQSTRWPCPRPYYGTMTNRSLVPVPSFVQWQELADEVDDLTGRIEALTRAIKIIGARPAEMEELDKLFNDTVDNEFIAVANWAQFRDLGGLEAMLATAPMERMMAVLAQLQEQRRERIDYIYQINGIGDILRGQGDPRATATQEKIKADYGSLRLKQMQQDLGAFIARVLEIKAEIICEKAPPEVLADVSAIGEVEQDRNVVQAAIQMLKNQRVRDLRIDVDEESMVALKDEDDRRSALEFVGQMQPMIAATAQAMNESPALLDVSAEAMLFAARRFRAGRDFEGALESFADATRQQAEAARKAAQSKPPQPPLPLMVEQVKAQNAARQEDLEHQHKLEQIGTQAQVERDKERSQALSEAAIEQARVESKERIAQMEASLDARLAQIELAADMKLEKYKADLKAQNDMQMGALQTMSKTLGARRRRMRENDDGTFDIEVLDDEAS